MKFTEAQLENAITELLEQEGMPHLQDFCQSMYEDLDLITEHNYINQKK
ncbi:MAG: hypothetical protein WD059_08055 [Balneolaceae bacterium]